MARIRGERSHLEIRRDFPLSNWISDLKFTEPRVDDHKLELTGVTGSFNMANVCVDIVPAIRVGQAKKIEIEFRGEEPLPFQVLFFSAFECLTR